jgi:hypothetical protein
MTTTVTSNLNLAKPDIGSEANNWGNVLNGTIDQIDKAIAQRIVKGVGGGSNVTLSDSESSFAIIEFQGTLTGNIDVKTASNDTKPYIIFNNTSGSYNLTFKSNSGTGVVIAQGLKSIVYGDGSNIVEATSPANSFSSSKTITLSGIVNGSVSTDFSSNPTITTTIVDGSIINADIDSAAAIDASKIADGSVSNVEFQNLNGVTTAIQTQINNKIDGSSLNASNLSSGTVPGARLSNIYPVGSIYMNVLLNDPNTLFGFGTWVRFGEGRMLVSQTSSDPDNDFRNGRGTGGAKKHTLSINEMPAHNHPRGSANGYSDDLGGGGLNGYIGGDQAVSNVDLNAAMQGGGLAHNNMPPYIVVYMWERTS